jgi:ubiquinone biosynthesis protein UbiJ
MVNPADEIAVLKKQVEDLKARLESIYILAKL